MRRRVFRPAEELRETGEEPDYRFSLANERTLLAYVRTALALMAAGVGLLQISDHRVDEVAGAALVVLGVAVALASYPRWWGVESALRRAQPLPLTRLPAVLAAALAVAGVVVLVGRLL
ncbi:YidH family protein [Motilibacter peucedani]|uniref:YidH family protein n=1 Tax=Motilibacter peucedani TaxID=598650 RepID=UPI001E5B1D03|nr:DUF202 domain-containing protein [Motilibacter peucedani]